MLILYKNVRNVRFVLFAKASNNTAVGLLHLLDIVINKDVNMIISFMKTLLCSHVMEFLTGTSASIIKIIAHLLIMNLALKCYSLVQNYICSNISDGLSFVTCELLLGRCSSQSCCLEEDTVTDVHCP